MTVLLVWELLLDDAVQELWLAVGAHAAVLFLVIVLNKGLDLIFKPVSELIEIGMIHQIKA
jgi:hypothetical protein